MYAAHKNNELPRLSLRQMHYALAAADLGSVTAAATSLNVSQPAVSVAIGVIEDHYQAPLFTRQAGQGVVPTTFGRQVFNEIRALLKLARDVENLSNPEMPLRGELRLGIYEALAPYFLPGLLLELSSFLPQVSVRFVETDLTGVMNRLVDGTIDLAISYDVLIDERVEATTLYSLQPYIMTAATHPLARRRRMHLKELASETLVLLDQEASAEYILGLLDAFGARPMKIIRATSFELQRSLVANGMGVAITHTRPHVEVSYDGRALHFIAMKDEVTPQRVLMARSSQQRSTPVLAAVQAIIAKHFSALQRDHRIAGI